MLDMGLIKHRNQDRPTGRNFERRRRRRRREHSDAGQRQEVRRQKNETSRVSSSTDFLTVLRNL